MSNTPSYAGDVTPQAAWDALKSNRKARLVDVRTQPEWTYVGVPDLSTTANQIVLLSWQVYPTLAVNEAFAQQVVAQGIAKDDPVYLLCRSGVRSKAAAEFLTEFGFSAAYNILEGFEGPSDGSRHRGLLGGWKADGLPWIQG